MMGSNLRVLYLQPAPLFGGAERQAAEQASFLPKLGVDLTLVGGPGEAIAEWMQGADSVRFVHSPDFPAWPPQTGLKALTLPFRYLRAGRAAQKEFTRIAQSARSEVIVASLPFTWFVGTLVARAAHIPVVWRAGGSRIPLSQQIALRLASRFFRPDLLLCNGEAVKRLFHPLIGGPVAVVPNGVDAKIFAPRAGDRARYRPADARLVVGFAGRLAPSKHVDDVIALAAELQQRYPDVRVLVAGSGSEREEVEEVARRAGATNVVFLGFVSDMASFYAACDLLVLTSDSEGSPNVLLEAMRSELAVVAAAIPPVLELVEDGKTGLVYPLRDVEALTAAVERLLVDPALRSSLAKSGARRVAFFTAEAAAARLARILREVVAAHEAKGIRRSPAETSPATTLALPHPTHAHSVPPCIPVSGPRHRG